MGIRTSGRVLEKSHVSTMRWEQKLANQSQQWSPPAPAGSDITVESDEVYTRISENLPPSEPKGWTVTFIERKSRYWIEARAGDKTTELFVKATKTAVPWAKMSQYIRWFIDGERRYAQQLWQLASVYLKSTEVSHEYGHRKVWRHGLEVAIKIKGSQGNRRVEWLKPEHPYTAISDKSDVHANHNEANNSALRRRCSAYRRRQNLYAKNTEGLQRVVTVQRLIHNWVRPPVGLCKNKTPAMAIGLFHRPLSMLELLSSRGFYCLTN
jgi:hypothetical protein